ncbi:MAG: hypothetical protein J0L84_02305 [Verrucomicrobia bacterium]|nr:hypothetical protein [Verrucomicrobiota bacterium]
MKLLITLLISILLLAPMAHAAAMVTTMVDNQPKSLSWTGTWQTGTGSPDSGSISIAGDLLNPWSATLQATKTIFGSKAAVEFTLTGAHHEEAAVSTKLVEFPVPKNSTRETKGMHGGHLDPIDHWTLRVSTTTNPDHFVWTVTAHHVPEPAEIASISAAALLAFGLVRRCRHRN